MIGIRIRESFIDLFPGTTLDLVFNNPAFVGGDIKTILGSHSIPINVPLTDNNKSVLGFPERVENVDRHMKDEACEIYYQGMIFLNGFAHVRSANYSSARIYITIDSFKALKTLYLNELDLGVHNFADVSTILAHAKDTAVNPLNYDHAFFPVLNYEYFDDDDKPEPLNDDHWTYRFQNYYDLSTQAFVSGSHQGVAMPFVRLDHVVSKIGTALSYSIESSFQNTDELKLLYLYNDFNIYIGDDWNVEFDLKNHVPRMLASEFLKQKTRLFCLGMFTDPFLKKIEIVALKDLLVQPFKHDWSAKVSSQMNLNTQTNFPGSLGFDSGNDGLFDVNQYEDLSPFTELDDWLDLFDTTPLSQGWYYLNQLNTFVWSNQHPWYRLGAKKKMFRRIDIDSDGQSIDFRMSPLFQQQVLKEDSMINLDLRDTPQISIRANSNKEARLTFYRGMYENHDNDLYPFASNNVYDPKEVKIATADQSLLMNGEYGLYENYWKEWIQFLMAKKEVQLEANLHITDIINFSFKDKVKVKENQYFVKQMKVSISPEGLLPTKLILASVL